MDYNEKEIKKEFSLNFSMFHFDILLGPEMNYISFW